MDKSQPIPPRVRLQELLAIPDRQRTDAEWDELNELEIMLASGNREGAPEQDVRRNSAAPGGRPRPNSGPPGRKPGTRFRSRPPRRNKP